MGWVLYVSCSKFVTNLSQESLCLLLTSLSASVVFLLYCSLSSSFFELIHFYMIFFFVSINCFIWSSHIFKYFLLFHRFIVPKLSFAADLNMFCKFFHSFSRFTSSSFILLKWSFTLWVYSHLMLSSFSNLTLKKIHPALMVSFCYSCLTIMVENLLLHIISNWHYLFHFFCRL